VAQHFARHSRGDAPVPDADVVERIVDAAFWASLRREEGRVPKVSLAYLAPGAARYPLLLERPLPLDPATLTRVAPAAERPGIHVGVWRDGAGGEPYIWGTTRTLPPLCFVLEVVESGLLVVKHRRANQDDGGGKFGNVAVLEGERLKVLDDRSLMSAECPDFVTSLLAFDTRGGMRQSLLLQLALSMRAHGHGGSLLVVPHGSNAWRESVVWPVRYAVSPPFARLGELARAADPSSRETLRGAIDAIGGLTAVDGATVLTDRWDLLAFGVKIGRRPGSEPVERLLVTEPIVGQAPVVAHPAELGGTRHLSAAQFVYEQRDALALVASQDGQFTVFSWDDEGDVVHAYRVESLLL
jgi:hypothetical protein